MKQLAIFATIFLCLQTSCLQAQDIPQSNREERIQSMGLPPRYKLSWNPMVSMRLGSHATEPGGHLALSLYRQLWHATMGVGITGEGYAGSIDGGIDGGVRALAGVKLLFSQIGIDYSLTKKNMDFILSLAFPLERGGIFGRGEQFRIDWLPGREHSVHLGINFPLGQPYLGKTRPKQDRVALPTSSRKLSRLKSEEMSPEIRQTLELLDHAAGWIARYNTPFFDQVNLKKSGKDLTEFLQEVEALKVHLKFYLQGRHTFQAEIETYHQMFDHAFILAVDELSTGDRTADLRIAEKARELILHDVILPYNHLIGLNKRHDSLLSYGMTATTHFRTWLFSVPSLSETQHTRLVTVFQHVIEILEKQRRTLKAKWNDAELVWIPLQYGLQPHQYDTQQELNAILEQITGGRFSHANKIYYIINEEFQQEVTDSIHQTEDYHVLWIHDYQGVTSEGNPDSIGFRQTVRAYLAALTQRVREYDATGSVPLYLILHDQYFYEWNEGKLWLELLQNPLEHELRLPSTYSYLNETLQNAQRELRNAVAESNLLQESARLYGREWLRNTIKVHVNITNPSDYSFRSAHLIPYLPFAPDELMRDHRKIVFYDVTERDPAKGQAIYGGMGVGEHYTGSTWEDRAILVRGPALVSLKNAARQTLLNQGFQSREIPEPLQKHSIPFNYIEMVDALKKKGWTATVMEVHNQTGFRSKPINALKASLYSLMPQGATIIVPDSLWNSPFWGGMLIGATLRGCRVLVIAPSVENAPGPGFPQMSRAQELFARLIILRDELQDELATVGGMLKVGIYNRRSDVNDTRAMMAEFRQGLRRYPFLKEIFPFSPDVYAVIDEVDQELQLAGFQVSYRTENIAKRKPKLHLKTNFFASAKFPDLLAWEGWDQVFNAYLYYRAKFSSRWKSDVGIRNIPQDLREEFNLAARPYWESLSAEERQRTIYYLTVGSHNQDYRGMIMDGEAVCVVAGYDSLVAMLDFFFMTGLTTWVEDLDTLETLLPAQHGWRKRLGRYIMKAL